MTKPHSDKSNRAKRRRQQKEIEKAQRGGARPPAAQPPSRGAQQGVPIDISALYQRIGVLTVERDHWASLALEASTVPDGAEMRSSAVRAMQQYEQDEAVEQATEEAQLAVEQATEAAQLAVDEGLDAESQSAADREQFPELQNTDGKVLAEAGAEPEDDDLQVTGAVEDDDPGPEEVSIPISALVDEEEPTETPAE